MFQTEGAREFFALRLQKNSRIILNPIHPKYIGAPKPAERNKTVAQSERLGRAAWEIAPITNGEAVYGQWRDYIEELCDKK